MLNLPSISLVLAIKLLIVPLALAQPWEIGGQVALTFAEGGHKISGLNDRLRQISSSLSPKENWIITPRPVFITQTEKNPKDPKAKPKTTKKLQSIELLLNDNLLLTVTETDVTNQGASSLEALAKEWQDNLNQFFRQEPVKRYLYLSQMVPKQLTYQGNTYRLITDVIPDRGLFRTTGAVSQGRVIFWEVPANDRTYLLDNKTKAEVEKIAKTADRIFIFDPKLQFIAYSKTGAEELK